MTQASLVAWHNGAVSVAWHACKLLHAWRSTVPDAQAIDDFIQAMEAQCMSL